MQAITEWFLTNPVMIVLFAGVTGFFDDYSSFLIAKKKDPDHKTDYEPKQAFRRVLRALIAGGVIALPGMSSAHALPSPKPLAYQDEPIPIAQAAVGAVWFPDAKFNVVYPKTVHREDDLFGIDWLDLRFVAFAGINREFERPFAGGAAAFGTELTDSFSVWFGPALKWQSTHTPDAAGFYGEVRYTILF